MEVNIQTLNRLLSEHSTNAQYQLMQIFNQLTNTPNGWKDCTVMLIEQTHNLISQTVFYFLRVVEHFVANNYASACPEDREWLRKFFGTWLDRNLQQPGFVRNKTAQLLALVCIFDCPSGQWSSFFDDLIQFASAYGPDNHQATDMVLRVLKALDGEIADRDIAHSSERQERNTLVKDWMRDHCVSQLAAWWLHVLTTFKARPDQAALVCGCLETVALFVAWVDISLVANDAFLTIFLDLLRARAGLCREAVCDCLSAVVGKGMPPAAKVSLVHQLSEQLARAGVYEVIGLPGAGVPAGSVGADDVDFLARLASLVNAMGLQTGDAYGLLAKAGQAEEAGRALAVFEAKVDLALNLLAFDDEEVSRSVAPLVQTYLCLLKPLAQQGLSDTTKVRIETILRTIFSRLKYDRLYDFDNEGEEEAIFQDYRKTVRVLITNMIQLAPDLVLTQTRLILDHTLDSWQAAEWNDIELAVTLFFQLGEAVSPHTISLASTSPLRPPTASSSTRKRAQPNPANAEAAEAIKAMLGRLCRSGLVQHPHPAVVLQYFETVARYERVFLSLDRPLLQAVIMDFLGDAGLRSGKDRVRVRCAYLFSRFCRTHKAALEDPGFAEAVLARLQPLLTLPSAPERISATSPCSSLDSDSGTSSGSDAGTAVTEQGYLFETAAFVVVTCAIPAERKAELVTLMLTPMVTHVPKLTARIIADAAKSRPNPRLQLLLAEAIRTCIDYACRSSKAFTLTATMEQCGCVDMYTHALQVFIGALAEIPRPLVEVRAVVATGLRIFLHRLVVCMGENILTQFAPAARELLATAWVKELTDFLPLLNQLMMKYKARVHAGLAQLIGALIERVLACLQSDADAVLPDGAGRDMQAVEEHRRLRRGFFLFFVGLLASQPPALLLHLEPDLQQRLLHTIVGGAMDVTDPQAQKAAFSALRHLIHALAGTAEATSLLQQVLPACLVAPARPDFDLRDAQTVLVLNEVAACLRAAVDVFGDGMLRYLSAEVLPQLNLPPAVVAEYLNALKNWGLKEFQQFLKKFYLDARQHRQQQAPS